VPIAVREDDETAKLRRRRAAEDSQALRTTQHGRVFRLVRGLTNKLNQKSIIVTFFTVRCYACAVLAMVLCLSVRLSVSHKSEFY